MSSIVTSDIYEMGFVYYKSKCHTKKPSRIVVLTFALYCRCIGCINFHIIVPAVLQSFVGAEILQEKFYIWRDVSDLPAAYMVLACDIQISNDQSGDIDYSNLISVM